MVKIKINQITETGNGDKVVFQGVLEGPELAFVVEVGLNVLMKEGALPFITDESFIEAQLVMDMPDQTQ